MLCGDVVLANVKALRADFCQARLRRADLTGARGLETTHADWIDIGPDGAPVALCGKDALSSQRDAV